MDQQQTIEALEARAKAAGVPIRKICELAGVHPTTFSRWKLSDRNPNPIGATFASLKKLNDALVSLEADDAEAA